MPTRRRGATRKRSRTAPANARCRRLGCPRIAPPWPRTPPTPTHRAAYADAEPRPFWMAAARPQDARPALVEPVDADLCIVGAGFTGLWAALHAKADDPRRDVVLLEAETAGFGASARNGGFAIASLTHGLANGLARFADEMEAIERLSLENFAALKADLDAHGIDCDFEEAGDLGVALEPHQVEWLEEEAELLRRYGHDVDVLDAAATRAEVDSPTYLGAIWDRTGAATLDPGKLAAGLRAAAVRAGGRVHEHTRATSLEAGGDPVTIIAPQGRVRARRVLLATSAFPPLLRAIRRYVVPVYDYALMTEPLGPERAAAIGWEHRQGIGDMGNQFHYYRRTADDRILFGGYDAVYRFGGPVGPQLDTDERTFGRLAQHFFTTFPPARGPALQPPLGRGDRHVQPVQRVLRHRPR